MDFGKVVREELSGSIAKSYVSQITMFHRIQASPMFHDAAAHVVKELGKIGIKDAKIEKFLADGRHRYWTQMSPMGWSVKSAELRLVEPEDQLLVRFEDTPQSLHTFSKGTPKAGVTAGLVDVGSGTEDKDYAGKKVKGKLVLATGRAYIVQERAVIKRGAAGVLTYGLAYEFPGVRESLDVPDAHSYQGIWPTANDSKSITFGFSLSRRQGQRLRSMMRNGKKVMLNAKVDAKLFRGAEEVVTATIRGSTKPEEEVFLIAHLCHPKPSANDNASGSGLLLEIARTMTRLISTGRIKRPARTIRFLWVPETLGTTAYLASHEDMKHTLVAGINLDMVGEDQELCKSTLNLDKTPDSRPSYLNDVVYNIMERSTREFDKATNFGWASSFRIATTPFSAGSDHTEFNDSTIGVPAVMFLQWPDKFYHTSMDTIDKVSEDSLRRVGWMTAVSALTIADADDITALEFASLTYAGALTRLAGAGKRASEEIKRAAEDKKSKNRGLEIAKLLAYHRSRIEHVTRREQDALRSVLRLCSSRELEELVATWGKRLRSLGTLEGSRIDSYASLIARQAGVVIPEKLPISKPERESDSLVPRRILKGTLNLDVIKEELGEKAYKWYSDKESNDPEFYRKTLEILNFMDGKKTVNEIVSAVSAEYSPTKHDDVLKLLRDLEKCRLVKLSRKNKE
ncbi:MAG TPA: PqqD family peptide modification chaperone [Thermoplasmata archaeon]|nr:PqqD family peptide modification chaperone [Thermoplasmata archaeon]